LGAVWHLVGRAEDERNPLVQVGGGDIKDRIDRLCRHSTGLLDDHRDRMGFLTAQGPNYLPQVAMPR
jgi:hypothetical protein